MITNEENLKTWNRLKFQIADRISTTKDELLNEKNPQRMEALRRNLTYDLWMQRQADDLCFIYNKRVLKERELALKLR